MNPFASLPSRIAALGRRSWAYAFAHKVIAGIALLIVLGGGYWAYASHKANATTTQYVLTAASDQSIESDITASGQVAADHQLDLTPKATGEVTSVDVKAGDVVNAGQLVATIDATDAQKTVRDAQLSLQSAQISYTQSITSANNTISNTQTSLATSQGSAFDAVTSAESSLSTVLQGLDTLIHGPSDVPMYKGDQNLIAYVRIIDTYVPDAQANRTSIQAEYDSAYDSYQESLSAYQSLSRTASPAETQAALSKTQTAAAQVTQVAKDVQVFLQLVQTTTQQHDLLTQPPSITTQVSSATSYSSTIANTTSALASAQSSLVTAQQSYSSNTQTSTGGTPLAIQSAQLTLAKARQALADAQADLADYVVRAPFDGTIAEVDVQKFDQTSGKVATLITNEQYAEISLNESDIASIRTGQTATLTFDAIDDLTIKGTVAQVNQIGTVSNGVTTYTVKIGFDTQDDRIKPGMTVNASIVTAHKDSALVVPSSAIKTQNGKSYVEVATMTSGTPGETMSASTTNRRARTASSTRPTGFGSSTQASSTRSFRSASRTSGGLTVSTDNVTVERVPITTGIVGDTTTEITSGLTTRQLVVSQSLNASGASTSSSSSGSFLSRLFGGSRSTTRTTGTTGTAGASRSGATGANGAAGGNTGFGGPPPGGF